MTITVKVGEAKTHLSELLAKVEAGEEVVIARGNEPIARLSRIRRDGDIASGDPGNQGGAGRPRKDHARRRFSPGATKAGVSDGRRRCRHRRLDRRRLDAAGRA